VEAIAPGTLDSLVVALSRQPLDFRPGTRTRYSNGGYALLASVIERASGASYADYMERAVFTPLRLAHTRHEADGMLIPGRTLGYQSDPVHARGLVPAPYQQMVTKTGGGSLVSNVGDLHRLLRALRRAPLLRDSTWAALFPTDSVDAFGGRCPGYNSYLLHDAAHDVDVVVLANNYSAAMVGTVAQDLRALARGTPVTPPAWRANQAQDPAEADRLVGTWRATERGLPMGRDPVAIVRRGGLLVLEYQGVPVDVLMPQGRGSYLLRALWCELRIDASAGARVTVDQLWNDHPPVVMERLP
jgi:hypothetical protein